MIAEQSYIEQVLEAYRPLWHKQLDNGELLVVVPLMYHVAVYVDPHPMGGCADRYCLLSLELAIRAIEEYAETGQMRYWQKWHSKNLSVSGRYLYPPGALMTPEHAVAKVDWDIDQLRKHYCYAGAAAGA